MKQIINKAGGILIQNRKLLVEKSDNKDFFIAPGGTIEQGETPKQALVRELMEEFQIKITEEDCVHFGSFTADAAGQVNKMVVMEVFIVNKWDGEPTPDNEVEQILWIDSSSIGEIKIGSIFEHEVIPRLKDQGLID